MFLKTLFIIKQIIQSKTLFDYSYRVLLQNSAAHGKNLKHNSFNPKFKFIKFYLNKQFSSKRFVI